MDLLQFDKYHIFLKLFKCFFFLFVLQKDIVLSNEKTGAEKINFLTANPFSFFHIITDLENQESQNAY